MGRERKFGDLASGSLGAGEDLIIGLGHRDRGRASAPPDENPCHGDGSLLDAVRAQQSSRVDTVSSTETEGFLS